MCEQWKQIELQQETQIASQTPSADKALETEEKDIANTLVKEIPWCRRTLNVIDHPNGIVILSKGKPDVEHYGDGKLPEDD